MKVVPGDLVLVRVKPFGPDHKIIDQWEQTPYGILSQHKDAPVYKVKPVDKQDSGSIHTLHQNMLFPFHSFREEIPTETPTQALINADIAMMCYFS